MEPNRPHGVYNGDDWRIDPQLRSQLNIISDYVAGELPDSRTVDNIAQAGINNAPWDPLVEPYHEGPAQNSQPPDRPPSFNRSPTQQDGQSTNAFHSHESGAPIPSGATTTNSYAHGKSRGLKRKSCFQSGQRYVGSVGMAASASQETVASGPAQEPKQHFEHHCSQDSTPMIFTTKEALKGHLRYCNKTYNLPCSYAQCTMVFRTKDVLDRHVRGHQGKNLRWCEDCEEWKSRGDNLRKHLKSGKHSKNAARRASGNSLLSNDTTTTLAPTNAEAPTESYPMDITPSSVAEYKAIVPRKANAQPSSSSQLPEPDHIDIQGTNDDTTTYDDEWYGQFVPAHDQEEWMRFINPELLATHPPASAPSDSASSDSASSDSAPSDSAPHDSAPSDSVPQDLAASLPDLQLLEHGPTYSHSTGENEEDVPPPVSPGPPSDTDCQSEPNAMDDAMSDEIDFAQWVQSFSPSPDNDRD